jgi:hypothetical protein
VEHLPVHALEVAEMIAARDWRPFPADHPGLAVCAGTGRACRENREKFGDCPSDKRGKHPVGGWGTMTASTSGPTQGMLGAWFGSELRNIGLACGPSKLLVLDEDTPDALGKLAESLGEAVPLTYRVRTSRGWHYYFEDPANEFGNSAGALEDWHIDVRGGKGSGGYVMAAGSVHWSGHVYEAEDAFAMPAPLPGWIKEQLRTPPKRKTDPSSGSAGTSSSGDWNDDPRYGTEDTLRAQYERHLAAVSALAAPEPNGEAFRHSLYLAALDGWRLVDCDLLDKITMLRQVKQAVRDVWRADPDNNDRAIVYDEARTKANDSPWVVVDPDEPSDADVIAAVYKRELDAEKRKERLRREARAELDAEGREPLRVLSFLEFLNAPPPAYLVPRMFYRDGLSVVFGAPGAAKSFLVMDIALCVASGKPWRGHRLERGKVHYIMAEGQATNTLRATAWVKYYEVAPEVVDENLTIIPTPVILTEPGVRDYLPLVERDKPDMIVLDTKNLMFAGKESQGDDYGAMLRVLHNIRQLAGGAAVILIDHSGLADDTRTRGSNAQKGGVETEIRVTDEGTYRKAVITRDKSGTEGAEWLFRLVQVEGVPRPVDVDPPAVCIQLDKNEVWEGNSEPLRDDTCWNLMRDELPDVVSAMGGSIGEAACDLFRLVTFLNKENATSDEMTFTTMFTHLKESPREHSRTTAYTALGKLRSAGIIAPGNAAKNWVVTAEYIGWRGVSG